MSRLFTSGGQSTGASASVHPVNVQGWYPLGLTGLISLLSKGLPRVSQAPLLWLLTQSPFWFLSGALAFWQPWVCVSAEIFRSMAGLPRQASLLQPTSCIRTCPLPVSPFWPISSPLYLVARSLTSYRDNGKTYDQASKKHLCHLQNVDCWSDTRDKCLCYYQRKVGRERKDNRWYKRGKK